MVCSSTLLWRWVSKHPYTQFTCMDWRHVWYERKGSLNLSYSYRAHDSSWSSLLHLPGRCAPSYQENSWGWMWSLNRHLVDGTPCTFVHAIHCESNNIHDPWVYPTGELNINKSSWPHDWPKSVDKRSENLAWVCKSDHFYLHLQPTMCHVHKSKSVWTSRLWCKAFYFFLHKWIEVFYQFLYN